MEHKKEKKHDEHKEKCEEGTTPAAQGFKTKSTDVVVDSDLAEVKKKAQEYNSLWDKYLRTCAEFENTRKRWERERQEIFKLGNFNLIGEVVVILDELEHTLRVTKEHSTDPEIIKGVELIHSKFVNILRKQGLKPIEAQGKKFDPHLHEIVGQRPTDEYDEYDEHVVIEEVQRGYFLEDKVLRTAKVIVAVKEIEEQKASSSAEAAEDKEDRREKSEDKS